MQLQGVCFSDLRTKWEELRGPAKILMWSPDIMEPLDITILSTRWASLECEITGKMSYCLRTSGPWGSLVPLVF